MSQTRPGSFTSILQFPKFRVFLYPGVNNFGTFWGAIPSQRGMTAEKGQRLAVQHANISILYGWIFDQNFSLSMGTFTSRKII